MALVGQHPVRPFVGPMNRTERGVDANEVRGNDEQLRLAHVAHDADPSIHVQSGTLANRPTTIADGSTYFCTDMQDTYSRVAGVWVQSAWAHWYGTAWSTADQPALVINTPQLATLNTTGILRGVTVASSQFTFQYANSYNLQFSAQVVNTDSQEHDIWFWFVKNSTAIPDSGGRITVPKKHGAGDGHALVCYNVYETFAANDTVSLYWESPSTLVSLETIPAAGTRPASPSVILTVNRI